MKTVVLYTELAGYMVSCFDAFVGRGENNRILLVHFPINLEAPFEFAENPGIEKYIYQKGLFKFIEERITAFKPDNILCSGWIVADYLDVCRKYYGLIPTVLCMDNAWERNWKQYIHRFTFRWRFAGCFSAIWVPGPPQRKYAEMLGFRNAEIHLGLYTADTEHFSEIFNANESRKKNDYPHRFISVARYIPEKNHNKMWEAFIRINEKKATGWEMWCLGTGKNFETRMIHPLIKHFGFIQPIEMEHLLKDAGVFILPSISEPWGVATHEMALSGLPLLVSNCVGSVSLFLEEGVNGYTFNPLSVSDIAAAMNKIIQLSDTELNSFSRHSHSLAMKVTTSDWVNTLESIR